MRYVIIGNGVAGTTAAANIRKVDKEGEISILTDEQYPFYSRIRLMDYLAGEVDENGLIIHSQSWYDSNGISLFLKTPVQEVDRNNKEVVTAAGRYESQPRQRLKYEKLLIATGGVSFVPLIPGSDKKGVFTLRTLKDAIEISNYAKSAEKVLLIGGGVLGLEAGNSLRKTGHPVAVVEFSSRLLPRQMDYEGAEMLKTQMEEMGFTFYLGAKSKEILGSDKAEGLLLEDGRKIDCDLIIISAGVRPNAGLVERLGIKLGKGLPVNDRLETEISDIYAAGDIIEHRGMFYGIWPASEKQGEIAGINMAGGNARYNGTVSSNVLKIANIDLVAAGDIDAEGKCECIIQKDRDRHVYRKLVIKEDVIAGCILYGSTADRRKVLKAIDEKRNISAIKKELERWNLDVL